MDNGDHGKIYSVIVPARNVQATLASSLAAIRRAWVEGGELIVVDDASSDTTAEVAGRYADEVIQNSRRVGRAAARNIGVEASSGGVLIFIDADVEIEAGTLERALALFRDNSDIDGVSGVLSAAERTGGWFTDYKNLYMHVVFSQVRGDAAFLFSSFCALRRRAWEPFDETFAAGEDTELGARLARSGHCLVVDPGLEVVHRKSYSFLSLMKNDAIIPFWWARILLKYFEVSGVGGDHVMAHASYTQTVSLAVSGLLVADLIARPAWMPDMVTAGLVLVWSALNARFLSYGSRHRGLGWLVGAVALTLADQTVMLIGALAGLVWWTLKR